MSPWETGGKTSAPNAATSSRESVGPTNTTVCDGFPGSAGARSSVVMIDPQARNHDADHCGGKRRLAKVDDDDLLDPGRAQTIQQPVDVLVERRRLERRDSGE